MGDRRAIYDALVDGAMEGLTDRALADFVMARHPAATNARVVHAALLALTDPDLRDRNIIDTICALAIRLRMEEFRRQDAGRLGRDAWPAPFGRAQAHDPDAD